MPEPSPSQEIFMTGGTGYLGQRLCATLLARGHRVRALARPGSERKLAPGCEIVLGDALRRESFEGQIPQHCTFVHLVGVSHPNPAKAGQFRAVDLTSVQAAAPAAQAAGSKHFVYVSVAHPAPLMQAYWQTRAQCEQIIQASGVPATILRPWYVLGPGHRWPYALLPLYWLFERLPAQREIAQRLGLVKLEQMITALAWAVEHPPAASRILSVPEIRQLGK